MTQTLDTIIIGGGISGLTVAWQLRQIPDHSFVLLEQSDRTGGAVVSCNKAGYQAEAGPHGFLDNCAESRQLLVETGLDKECLKAPLANFVRYVCIDGSLKCIPQSPPKIIAAPLISPLAKLRVLADLWKKPLSGEPTVSEWVQYRFGKALLPYVDAVFTGTYAGDFERLLIDAVMPGVRQVEKEHGSVIRGLLKKKKSDKEAGTGKKKGLPAMTSFPTGMERLVQRLGEELTEGKEILHACMVDLCRKDGKHWLVDTAKGTFRCSNLVLAVPVNSALSLLQTIAANAPQTTIPEGKIVTVALGFGSEAYLPPGFGYLAPEQEKRFCLGALFSSNMFPGRAPEGHILLEALVGGRRHPERLSLDDKTLIRDSVSDLKQLLNLPGEPTYAEVLRPKGGIPQLEAGYPALLKWRNDLMQREKGLYITGFGWEGIGLNEMIKTAFRVTDTITAGILDNREEKQEVKKIYF